MHPCSMGLGLGVTWPSLPWACLIFLASYCCHSIASKLSIGSMRHALSVVGCQGAQVGPPWLDALPQEVGDVLGYHPMISLPFPLILTYNPLCMAHNSHSKHEKGAKMKPTTSFGVYSLANFGNLRRSYCLIRTLFRVYVHVQPCPPMWVVWEWYHIK